MTFIFIYTYSVATLIHHLYLTSKGERRRSGGGGEIKRERKRENTKNILVSLPCLEIDVPRHRGVLNYVRNENRNEIRDVILWRTFDVHVRLLHISLMTCALTFLFHIYSTTLTYNISSSIGQSFDVAIIVEL